MNLAAAVHFHGQHPGHLISQRKPNRRHCIYIILTSSPMLILARANAGCEVIVTGTERSADKNAARLNDTSQAPWEKHQFSSACETDRVNDFFTNPYLLQTGICMTLTIEDKFELHELAGRYGDIIDDRNWSALDSIFTEDAVFEVVALVTMKGLPEIKRYMAEEGRHPLAHLITNIHVEEHGSSVRLLSRGIFPISSESGGAGHRVFYGSYYDEACKTPNGWRISNRVFSTNRRTGVNQ